MGQVTLALNDRVLLSGQSNTVQNGVYVVSSDGALLRSSDMPLGSRAAGSVIMNANTGARYLCWSSTGADVVGTHALRWQEIIFNDVSLRRAISTGERAPVALLINTPMDINSPPPLFVTGVQLVAGIRVLLVAQTNAVQNGIWTCGIATWTRTEDMAAGSHASGATIPVTQGDRAGQLYRCSTAFGADIVGLNTLSFPRFLNTVTDVQSAINGAYVQSFVTPAYVNALGINAVQLNEMTNQQLRVKRMSNLVRNVDHHADICYLNDLLIIHPTVYGTQLGASDCVYIVDKPWSEETVPFANCILAIPCIWVFGTPLPLKAGGQRYIRRRWPINPCVSLVMQGSARIRSESWWWYQVALFKIWPCTIGFLLQHKRNV